METATMDLNMDHNLSSIYQNPLLLVFLDLRKTYEMLDHGRLLHNLEGYGAGPKLLGILE